MTIVGSVLVYGLLFALVSRAKGNHPEPLVAYFNNQVQCYNSFNTTFPDKGLGHLVATFNTNYVTFDTLPELADSGLIQTDLEQPNNLA